MSPTIHLPKTETVADNLAFAKNLLETDGWTIGLWKCSDGSRCAAGAIRAACGHGEIPEAFDPMGSAYDDPTYQAAIEALAVAINPRWYQTEVRNHQGYSKSHVASAATRARWAEDFVACYNDDRVKTTVGRNAVLRRFDKAIAATS